MDIVPQKLAAKIDAKVAEGKVIANWREGWKFGSILSYACIFLLALGQGGLVLAAPVAAFWTLWPWAHLAMSLLMIVLAIAGTYARLTNQKGLKPVDPPQDSPSSG